MDHRGGVAKVDVRRLPTAEVAERVGAVGERGECLLLPRNGAADDCFFSAEILLAGEDFGDVAGHILLAGELIDVTESDVGDLEGGVLRADDADVGNRRVGESVDRRLEIVRIGGAEEDRGGAQVGVADGERAVARRLEAVEAVECDLLHLLDEGRREGLARHDRRDRVSGNVGDVPSQTCLGGPAAGTRKDAAHGVVAVALSMAHADVAGEHGPGERIHSAEDMDIVDGPAESALAFQDCGVAAVAGTHAAQQRVGIEVAHRDEFHVATLRACGRAR